MAYPSQGKRIIDETKRLNMSLLAKMGYVHPGFKTSGVIEWSENFKIHAVIGIRKSETVGFMQLDYTCNGESVQYNVNLVARQSNLGNESLIWYFICPSTMKLCRKLYFNGRLFVHQTEIEGLYACQALSKKERDMDKLISYLLGPNDIYSQLHQKHLKRFYRGKMTKKYKNLVKWKRRVDLITAADVERLLITGSL